MKKWLPLIFMLGILLVSYALYSAFLKASIVLYSYFVIGGTMFFGYINYESGSKSLFYRMEKDRNHFLKTYFLYLLLTIITELIAKHLLGLWIYPSFGLMDIIINVYLIGYPFCMFMTYELIVLLRRLVSREFFVILIATIASALMAELPNTHAWEWIYLMPFVTLEIFRINILVFATWLILMPFVIYINEKMLGEKKAYTF